MRIKPEYISLWPGEDGCSATCIFPGHFYCAAGANELEAFEALKKKLEERGHSVPAFVFSS